MQRMPVRDHRLMRRVSIVLPDLIMPGRLAVKMCRVLMVGRRGLVMLRRVVLVSHDSSGLIASRTPR
jgi:hypothetical protein